ncbi:class I SAM-dependent methyltransferase [Acinetobacter sp. ESL0695]|uniref:class I SAM-dependent DNA methyltransferase n=1 Tax=Acinetobacter sp. ESL0695 TaxID=2983215 RepID=UPI0023F092F0|nr:class I SAM-dependent methyltransferase [Acinetobacter sp. ESL0695]WEV49098.1 class I SAM-dependent methyltransferase [Acinetobacter sp. ESL0695]
MSDTLDNLSYYNKYAEHFFETTYLLQIDDLYEPFLSYLPPKSFILDLGCGSGRDTLAFKNKGYQVEALDYSIELVKKATQLTGLNVKHESFYNLTTTTKYDGIWACASLLHCKRDQLIDVITRIHLALKPNGICYMSFKYGNKDREQNGRSFTDLNEEQAHSLLKDINHLLVLKQWITLDQRPDHDEKWLNILFKRVS